MKRIILAVTLPLFIASCAPRAALDSRITAFTGDVFLNGVKITQANARVKSADSVETGPGAFCDIMVGDKNIFHLKGGTKIIFNVSDESNIIRLERGWFAGITRKQFTRAGSYIIHTPTLAASVRGTYYCAKVESPESTYFCVCNGSIALAGDIAAKGDTVAAAHHAARRFSRDKSGRLAVDANPGLLYHDDAGVAALAKKIGETVDWTRADER